VKAGGRARLTSARSLGVGAVAALLLTSACAAGQYAQSASEQETLDGTSAHVGTMTLGGLAIEAPTDGISWAKDSNVPLKVVVVNSGQRADTLTDITSPQIASWAVYASPASAAAANAPAGTDAPASSAAADQPASESPKVTVAGHSREQFGTELFGTSVTRVLLLNGVNQSLSPGSAIELTFTFARAGTVTVRVPVQVTKSPQTSVIPAPSGAGGEG
jgi:copper(I)-binding protein